VRKVKRSFLIIAIALAVAMMIPAQAMAWDWSKVGENPLKKGGVKSVYAYSSFMTGNARAKKAVQLVARRNGMPSWIADAAIESIKSGDIHGGTIKRKTRIGAMSFGSPVRVIGNTRFMRKKALKCFYTHATRARTEMGTGGYWEITETYKVWTAQECANVFIYGHSSSRIWHPGTPPPSPDHRLSVEGTVTPVQHLDRTTFSAVLRATVTGHSDNDALLFTWSVDGVEYNTTLQTLPVVLRYNDVHIVSVSVLDAAGHTAQYNLAPFNQIGPGDPPPPL
jgi:hypothetical protein